MGMNVSSAGGKNAIQPSMNVTPLVDIVLVLLIIFMVITPLLNKQFWLQIPQKDDAEVMPEDAKHNIVLSVEANGQMRINDKRFPKEVVQSKLARMVAARSDKTVYFDADDKAPYAATVVAMDIARGSGAKNVAIMTEKLKH